MVYTIVSITQFSLLQLLSRVWVQLFCNHDMTNTDVCLQTLAQVRCYLRSPVSLSWGKSGQGPPGSWRWAPRPSLSRRARPGCQGWSWSPSWPRHSTPAAALRTSAQGSPSPASASPKPPAHSGSSHGIGTGTWKIVSFSRTALRHDRGEIFENQLLSFQTYA